MPSTLPNNNPLSYLGVKPETPPNVYRLPRAPSANDIIGPNGPFQLGDLWVDTAGADLYGLVLVAAGSATWNLLASTPGEIATLTGDTGGAITPVTGNIDILGDSTDGVSVAGTAGTLTINVAAASTVQRGTLETSTDAESVTGTSTTVAVTPASLTARLEAPGPIGPTTPSSATFTDLTANGTIDLNTTGAGVTTIGTGGTGATNIGNATGNTDVTGSLTASTGLVATTGGVTATAGDITATADNIIATAGDIIATAGDITATAGAVSAGTTVTGGTGLVATTGGVTATAGDIVATAGDVILDGAASQIHLTGGAVTDFIGTATLTAGAVTVANTNIAATDRIFAVHIAPGASTEVGVLTYAINAGADFTITSLDPSDASTATGDISTIAYVIFRQI